MTLSDGVYANGVPGISSSSTYTTTRQIDTATNSFDITAYRADNIYNCEVFYCGTEVVNGYDGPFTLISPPLNASNSGTYNPTTQKAAYDFNLSRDIFGTFSLQAEAYLIFNGQDPFALAPEFGADIAAHMDYLIRSGTLPSDWFALSVGVFDAQSYPNPFIQEFYVGNEYFTLADVSVVPEPTILALMALGIMGMGYFKRKEVARQN